MKTFLLAVFILFAVTTKAANYYFSSISGNDTYTFLQAQDPLTPWKTLTKFNSVFASFQPGDSVLFKRGETFYGSILISRSGTSVQPIIIGAYGAGSNPVITGFQTITNWTSIGGGVSENTCTSCLTRLNMVTINDTLQPVGRWPKATDPNGGYLTIGSHTDTTSIASNDLIGAPNFIGGEIVMRKYPWILDRATITGQGASSLTFIPLIYPSAPGFNYPIFDGHGFFIQNHPATFSKAGDWSYDSVTKKIKVYNIGAGIVKVSTIENLVEIGSRDNIRFDNLAFNGANSNTFYLDTCNNIQINHCDIDFSGIDAIHGKRDTATLVDNPVSNHINVRLYNSTISNTNNTAISANSSLNWTIQKNSIRNTALHKGMGQSGDGQYFAISYLGDKSLVADNEIKKTGYIGIYFTGDSTVVKNNFVDTFCLVKSDGGGIYTYFRRPKRGRKIISNIVLNGIGDRYGIGPEALNNPFAGNVHGIYIDNGDTHIIIDSNTAANCNGSGFELSSPADVQVTNNTSFNNTTTQILYLNTVNFISNLVVKHNLLFSKRSDQLISSLNGSFNPDISTWGIIDSNYYCRPISEPAGVDTVGYSHSPSLFDYPDGGIIQMQNFRFYSLDKWQTLSNQDAHTKKTQAVNIDPNNVRFEYNATHSNKIVALDGSYRDVKNNLFINSVTLAPFSSIILLKTSSPIVLPLQVLDFGAYKAGTEADLKWTTANEVNTLLFSIERSSDGINFTGLDNIPAKNIAGNINLYNYRDKHPVKGNNFYRLKQVDLNGAYSYSKIVKIFFEEEVTFQISPNPVRNKLRIVIDKNQNVQKRYLSIQTLTGTIVKSIPVNSASDITIDMSKFTNGSYIVSLISKNYKISKKIVKAQ